MMGKSMFIIMNTQCLKLMFLPLTNLTITHVNYYHRRQDISKSIGQIFMYVCGRVGHRPRTNPLHFG